MKTIEIIAENNYARIDVFLSENTKYSRSAIKKIIDNKNVSVNGKAVKASAAVNIGDKVCLIVPKPIKLEAVAENIPIDIVYQDDYLAVINKPQGLTVHPAAGNIDKTLVNALLFHIDNLSTINGVIRPGIVHRIDKDTSGLLVVAKCDEAHISLSNQIAAKTCTRVYRAITEGVIKTDSGIIRTKIGRSKTDRKKMAVTNDGREAVTHYKVLQRFESNTYLELQLETGRTHQIRVHLKHIGHPIVGDLTYGYAKQKYSLNGQLLHACRLEFVHPMSGEKMQFSAPLPDYFEKILTLLK